ncbi:Site-specific recombinase XerD [Tenacibaculum sp. 190130A14a]|uniref:Site-specific recombinase XerD n=1 Tax=Tenacibaculum polynesiense TaxID=3137857 RepID=A0ABM9PAW5_9FLAO
MSNSQRTKGQNIRFRLKSSQKELKPIYLDLSLGRGKRFRYSIGYSVNPKYWNEQKERVKNAVMVSNSNEINDRISDIESELFGFIAKCDSQQIQINKELLKECLDVFLKKVELKEEKEYDLLTYGRKYVDLKEKELGNSGGVKKYKQTLRLLEDFQKDLGYKLSFKNIDNEFYSEFVDFLNTKEHSRDTGYATNSIGKHIKTIKTFMNSSLEQELHTNFKFKKFKVLVEETTAIYLTEEELQKMLDLDLSKKPKLELARDIFIIGCEIGQRISDYSDMQKHEIVNHKKEKYIKIKQEKTDKQVLCRITEVIEDIMNKRYNGSLPPKISHPLLNSRIKEVGELAEVNSEVNFERTQGGIGVVKKMSKFDLIMGHTARRTFCTLKYMGGVPINDIMELSGHSSIKEFMKYIRNPKEERVSMITNTEAFRKSSLKVS